MVKQPMVARQVRVPEKLWDDAKAAADQNDENISDVLRRALSQYVADNPPRIGTMTADGKWTGTIAEAEALVKQLLAPDGTITIKGTES